VNFATHVHWMAATALERLLFCLAEGTALVLVLSALLQFLPARDSRTRFRLWFSALVATASLPLLTALWTPETVLGAPRPVLNVSFSVAEYVVATWALLAFCGVLRVVAGLVQVRKLRNACRPLELSSLGAETAQLIADFRKRRSVEMLVAERAHVPSAIGFFRPAIILPAWLVEEGASDEFNHGELHQDELNQDELKHVVLHELAHLRRYDDWTNLAQQMLKAILFFHPAVWWMERNLVLDREIACDDAVLAQTGSPRVYAQCLAQVAEKSFLRRQLALAQAAVSRVRQLSRRVARILDANRPYAVPVWKPAVPVALATAIVCGISFAWIPGMVQVGGSAAETSLAAPISIADPLDANQVRAAGGRLVPASLTQQVDRTPVTQSDSGVVGTGSAKAVRTKDAPADSKPQAGQPVNQAELRQTERRQTELRQAQRFQANLRLPEKLSPEQLSEDATSNAETANLPAIANGKHVTPPAATAEEDTGFVLVISSQQTVTQGPEGVQVKFVEVRMLVPVSEFHKQFPRKT